MSVRAKIVLAIFCTGALAVLGVATAVGLAFQRFEHESAYARADAFLRRVIMQHPDLLALQRQLPEQFQTLMINLVLYEPDSQLYLLAPDGAVRASSVASAVGTRVTMKPVRDAAGELPMPYVIGDDPARGGQAAIVAARPLHDTVIRPSTEPDGYLYLVCVPRSLGDRRTDVMFSTLSQPALVVALMLLLLLTGLAMWMAGAVTRPLARLSAAVDDISRAGMDALVAESGAGTAHAAQLPEASQNDEFGRLARGFARMLERLQSQWQALRNLDHFRREGVSNLSHDLRSPLTATAACLETLDNRFAADPARAADRELVQTALRNTRNTARLVQSLGDLAQLDEPSFKLRAEPLDLVELVHDVAMRFAERAAAQGVTLRARESDTAVPACVDVELIERALANLLDNALKFTPRGGHIELIAHALDAAQAGAEPRVRLTVRDSGAGIAPADQPHLFDRFYQARQSSAPATGEGGKGLGLAIVKRIAELHGGTVHVDSTPGSGTQVCLLLPPDQPHPACDTQSMETQPR